MRTFPLYDPKIYSLMIFSPREGKEKDILSMLKVQLPKMKGVKCDVSFKDGMSIIEIMMNISPEQKGPVDISPELLKVKYNEISQLGKPLLEKIQPYLEKGVSVHQHTLFTCGSSDKVWSKTFSDISFLYKEQQENSKGSDILQSNVSYLDRIMNRSGEVLVNSIVLGKIAASLYLLGHPQGRSAGMFRRDMVLEIDMGEIMTAGTYAESPIEVSPSTPYSEEGQREKKMYQMRQNYLINLMAVKAKLTEILIIRSMFSDIRVSRLEDLKSRGTELRDQISQLQKDIYKHMKIYINREKKKKGKERDFLDRETFNTEKGLLTTASVRFSLVSEVEHEIMKHSSVLQSILRRIDDTAASLSLRAEVVTTGDVLHSIGDLTKQHIEESNRELTELMDELSHSRDILSSTIDVLRTFIDTRQREVSEEMSRLMNVLFLVFACIGLADALGNFVIIAIEYIFLKNATPMEVLQWTSLGLMLTLAPLLIAVIFLVMFFNKKR